jgi:hypothetical protein
MQVLTVLYSTKGEIGRCGARARWADRIVMPIATHPPIQRHYSTTTLSSTTTADDHDEAAEAATVTIVMGNMGVGAW